MSRLRVADVLSARVVRADAESRLDDVRDEIARCEATHVAVHEQGRFRGLVRLRDVALSTPQRIFADLLPPSPVPPLAPEAPVSEIGWMLAESSDALPVLDAAGEFVGIVTRQSLLAALLAEHKRVDEQARRLHSELADVLRLKVMREMAAGIAHELHQPLAVISNYVHGTLRRLEQGRLDQERLAEVLRHVAEETQRAAAIIRRIREFLATRERQRRPVDLNQTIRDALQLASWLVRQRETALELHLADGLPPVSADPLELTQIVLDLLLNGLDAMHDLPPAERRLTVQTGRTDAGEIEVAVADTGHGIPTEHRDRIFDQFFTTRAEGLGLGLSLSRSIVEDHGGRMIFESQPGRGTRFRFVLPAANP